ncbi:unconventional myosin-IXb-like isoform X2 [Daphnia carinata]|uniref:unconventional myosin-IXb-like isoform X2 n=1 Tax=Daphnia carinata TaxID=120202 RepID=UPI0028694CCA|nr:unconventional myosin-IXb-like isoform X2 [Daphnia carinata]
MEPESRYIVQVFVGALSPEFEALSIEALKGTTADEMVCCIVDKLQLPLPVESYELAEVVGNAVGQECKERRLAPHELPVALMLLWPKVSSPAQETASALAALAAHRKLLQRSVSRTSENRPIERADGGADADESQQSEYRFYLREKLSDAIWSETLNADPQLIRDYFYRFLYQPRDREYPDLCQLPDLNEETLMDNLRARFQAGHIYTYVGSILIAVNPFKFYPIYNPKYVKLYQNRRLGELPPHIFAVADAAYNAMMRDRKPQCIVISGESGSGKTESTNFLLHHLTALSQKGSQGCGVEQTILSAGPVLEAFGNAKTSHNNNSSRFGKFIQVNYRENGQVHGALVQKYLLEKTRICFQAKNERNYHVFYHLLVGSSPQEKQALHLLPPEAYRYLNQSDYHNLDEADECYELSRLKQSMEFVGFCSETQRRVFAVLSAVLHIGNVEFQPKKSTYHHDESVTVKNTAVVTTIAQLLRVKEEILHQALVSKRARASGETLVINYRMPEAIAARDAMAKCLYGSLFDWIVMQLNHALLAKKDADKMQRAYSIGVLDIFGFEDFGNMNSFEQFCINYANEHLQYYFNQHVFKYEQEEYKREGIHWVNIQFVDNTGCLQLYESKPNGLLCILDDQCNFPGATNETLLQKFNSVNKDNEYYEVPQKREAAFIVRHYAGKVKYQSNEFREKNLDLMKADIVAVLKSSQYAFVRELVGGDPVAVFRWAILRAFIRAYFAFLDSGKRHREINSSGPDSLTGKGKHGESGRKNRVSKARSRPSKNWRNLETVKTLAGRLGHSSSSLNSSIIASVSSSHEKLTVTPSGSTTVTITSASSHQSIRGESLLVVHKNVKKAQTVGAQFQHSLQSLMVALNTANPFFVRCIKSNRLKGPNQFDEEIVLRQLRYTGMLETVRIRQAGFNVRLTFEEFIHHYRILLPRGLLSSQSDVHDFLRRMNLNSEHYQIGHQKIFLRESEKAKLDYRLHQAILASIVTIQRWFRTCLERRNFLSIRRAVVRIQSYVRMIMAQRQVMNLRVRHMAATFIQKVWRGYQVRHWYTNLRCSVVSFQCRARGNLARRRFEQMKQKGDAHSAQSTDEAFLSKGSSQEELDKDTKDLIEQLSSEESSGIQEDSESELIYAELASGILSCALNFPLQSMDEKRDDLKSKKSKPSIVTAAANVAGVAGSVGHSPRIGSIEELLRGSGETGRTEKSSALHKAKKHLKTLMGGGSKRDKSDSLRQMAVHGSEDRDSDSESTLVSASRSTSTLNSASDLEYDMRYAREREARREERRRIIAERLAIRSRANSISDESHSPTCPNPVLCRRYSRDIEAASSSIYGYGHSHGHLHQSHCWTYSHAVTSHLPIARRGSKDGGRSVSVDGSWRGSRDSLRERVTGTAAGMTASPLARRQDRDSSQASVAVSVASSTSSTTATVRSSLSQVHKLTRMSKLAKNEACSLCSKTMSSFFTHGYKCTSCHLVFHAKCVQQGITSSQALPPTVLECARPSASPTSPDPDPVQKGRKGSRETVDSSTGVIPSSGNENSKWNLTGTSEFTDSTQEVVNGGQQLHRLDEFIGRKIQNLVDDTRGDADRVFLSALRELRGSLISAYGVASCHGGEEENPAIRLTYRDLIANFSKIVESVSRDDTKFPKTLVVNAFRGYLNEFVVQQRTDDKENRAKGGKRRKERWKKPTSDKNQRGRETKRAKAQDDGLLRHMGHEFTTLNSVITIPTACEVCSSFTWLKEKGLVCQSCKFTCHKKCYTRITTACTASAATPSAGAGSSGASSMSATISMSGLPNPSTESPGSLFGVTLDKLVASSGAASGSQQRLPPIIERLISTIELVGLYTEGLYRKSGVSSRVQQLKKLLEEESVASKEGAVALVDLQEQPIHVLTAVLKSFLRELPQPLLTYERYDDFLRAADIVDAKERISSLMALVQELPPHHFDLLERLIFHLTRVALNEKSNRMSPNALSIVFAPCILRTAKLQQAQDSLSNVSKQTSVVETILTEQLRRVTETLADIDSLDSVCLAYAARLGTLRSSKMFPSSTGVGTWVLPQSDTSTPDGAGAVAKNQHQRIFPTVSAPTSSSSSLSSLSARDQVTEERLIQEHLEELREEKAALAATLPSLARAASDDDLLSTDGDLDGDDQDSPIGGSVDDLPASSQSRSDSRPKDYEEEEDDLEFIDASYPKRASLPFVSPLPLRSKAAQRQLSVD